MNTQPTEKKLSWALLSCDDETHMNTYMAYIKRNQRINGKRKKKICLFATVLCDMEKEELIEVHYHKFAFKEQHGIARVRSCMEENEWPIDFSKEFVRLKKANGTKLLVPLGEYLSRNKKEKYDDEVLN